MPAHPLPFDPIRRAGELWTEHFGEDAPVAAMATATSLMRVQQLILARLDAAVAPFGLTFARYEALVLLRFSRHGRLPMRVVGERLMIHPTSATNIVQRLAAQGLVERIPNPDDGRGTLAQLTDEGDAVMRRATQALHRIEFGLPGMDASTHGELFALLHDLRVQEGDFVDE